MSLVLLPFFKKDFRALLCHVQALKGFYDSTDIYMLHIYMIDIKTIKYSLLFKKLFHRIKGAALSLEKKVA